MNIILFLAFFIFGLNCRSISRRKAINENHHFNDNQWSIVRPEGLRPCLENVSKWCQTEYRSTKEIEDCKCDGFKRKCYRVDLCSNHLPVSKPESFI